ncbi:MAG: IS5 family transposase [Nannocystis sp.]|nr:IS5 family transposase [Nannocystis sp.]MBA3546875.1 IS5 family transposase [Nannocystis sp.]
MRGDDRRPDSMFSYVSPEQRVPSDHPLRAIRVLVDEVLAGMSHEFDGLYAAIGRPSVPPERLLRAQLLQMFYSIRSERLLMEQLDYNILFRWFVGMDMDEPVWAPTVFTKNRDRLLNQEIARSFFRQVLARATGLMSDEHFTVDGTLIEAWAGQKSFRRKDDDTDGDGRNFHGQSRKNDTHASTTDPEARLYRKGNAMEARLAYVGHLLIDNRQGLIVDAMATQAEGFAERDAALQMLQALDHERPRRRTLGADKSYDTTDFVAGVRAFGATPHLTQNLKRTGGSAIDRRTTRHPGYAQSQARRPRVEPAFGWLKTIAGLRKVKLRGLANVDALFIFASAAFNLLRLPKLLRPVAA